MGNRPVKVLLIILALIYFLSPYDVLPDFLIGWGWLDDGAILFLLWKYFIAPAAQRRQAEKLHRQNWQYFRNDHGAGQAGRQGYRSESGAGEDTAYRDPYRILGIERNASQEEIKKAFKQLANKYHPDKVQHLGEEFRALAEDRFKEIQEAYQALRSVK